MKNLISIIFYFFLINISFGQEKAIQLTEKNYKGEFKEWAILKDKKIYLNDIYYLINVKEYLLLIPKSQEPNEVKITSNFLSSGHTTGSNLKLGTPIYKFEFDKKSESMFTLQGYYNENK
tara:strand:+ start:129 stop:488 length:360 start_codon:yes stop_codon:yes gene_type:complete